MVFLLVVKFLFNFSFFISFFVDTVLHQNAAFLNFQVYDSFLAVHMILFFLVHDLLHEFYLLFHVLVLTIEKVELLLLLSTLEFDIVQNLPYFEFVLIKEIFRMNVDFLV